MASYIFQRIARYGKAEGIDQTVRQRDARTWFRNQALAIRSVNRNQFMRDPDADNFETEIDGESIGSMYSFFYDPKNKKTRSNVVV